MKFAIRSQRLSCFTLARAVAVSATFALAAPRWLPIFVRRAPLRVCIAVYVVRFKLGAL